MLGLSFQKDQSFTNKGKGINGPNDKVHYVGSNGWGGDNGLNNTASSGENPYYVSAFEYNSDFTEERMNSYFGRLTYNFKEKYMLEATGYIPFGCCRLGIFPRKFHEKILLVKLR